MKLINKSFLDKISLCVRAGRGGHGHPKYGGVGGNGADVYVEGSEVKSLDGLVSFTNYGSLTARPGEDSRQFQLKGKDGEPFVFKCPIGTVVHNELGVQIGEILKIGEKFLLAKGGRGGLSLNSFIGALGEEAEINLVLKLVSNVGLIGFTNAGKSTVFNELTKSRSKISGAKYTTSIPQLGTINYDDCRQITIVDTPSIKNTLSWRHSKQHENDFLRHIERANVLVFVVDVDGYHITRRKTLTAFDVVISLTKQLEMHEAWLLDKPSILVVNKMDRAGSDRKYSALITCLKHPDNQMDKRRVPIRNRPRKLVKFKNIIPVSGNFNADSMRYLKRAIREAVDESARDLDEEEKTLVVASDYIKSVGEHLTPMR